MHLSTDGIVIKQRNIGEEDKIITVLTRDSGVIDASVRGARRIKSRLLSSVGLFSYSDFIFYKGKSNYIVNSAESKESFYAIADDIEKLSLAFYLCDLIYNLASDGDGSEELLRLLLNSLYLLKSTDKSVKIIKAVFELKSMQYSGYMPDFFGCSRCGCNNGQGFYFDVKDGRIICAECLGDGFGPNFVPLPPKTLLAARLILTSDVAKAFSFTLSDSELRVLSDVCEKFVIHQLNKKLKTLEFYDQLVTEQKDD